MTTPDFVEDEHPRDGSRSVTSLGSQGGPLNPGPEHPAPAKPSRAGSLATPGLGVHVMDDKDDTDKTDDTDGGSTE